MSPKLPHLPGIEIITTDDGSPTALLKNELGMVEPMHNLKGALSETLYVYGEALQTALKIGSQLNVLSVGLGLGYNELLTAAFALKYPALIQSLISYESRPELIEHFLSSLTLPLSDSASASPLPHQITQHFAAHFQIPAQSLLEKLKTWRAAPPTWILKGRWTPVEPAPQPFHVLLYDPFSEKMAPEFWTEDSINIFLQDWCAPQCVLSTYAAKGVLNRGLKRHGFELQDRPGFAGKKQCTLATRGF